jgi:hypothetical protein
MHKSALFYSISKNIFVRVVGIELLVFTFALPKRLGVVKRGSEWGSLKWGLINGRVYQKGV